MNEHDAHKALTDTTRLRILDPFEQTQLMSFSERRYRAREARQQMLDAAVADDVHRYRRLNTIRYERIMREEALRRWPDFRDDQPQLTSHEIAQRDGFPDT